MTALSGRRPSSRFFHEVVSVLGLTSVMGLGLWPRQPALPDADVQTLVRTCCLELRSFSTRYEENIDSTHVHPRKTVPLYNIILEFGKEVEKKAKKDMNGRTGPLRNFVMWQFGEFPGRIPRKRELARVLFCAEFCVFW